MIVSELGILREVHKKSNALWLIWRTWKAILDWQAVNLCVCSNVKGCTIYVHQTVRKLLRIREKVTGVC